MICLFSYVLQDYQFLYALFFGISTACLTLLVTFVNFSLCFVTYLKLNHLSNWLDQPRLFATYTRNHVNDHNRTTVLSHRGLIEYFNHHQIILQHLLVGWISSSSRSCQFQNSFFNTTKSKYFLGASRLRITIQLKMGNLLVSVNQRLVNSLLNTKSLTDYGKQQ